MTKETRGKMQSADRLVFIHHTFLLAVLLVLLLVINGDSLKGLFAIDTRDLTASASMVIKPEAVSSAKLTGADEKVFLEEYGITNKQLEPLRGDFN